MKFTARFPFKMSLNASLWFVLFVCANLVIQVENKSIFGIGTRIIGDQLLLKDVLQTPPISLTEEPVIKFNYAIVEPITYIEIESDKNVYAIVNFSYENNLVEGTISSVRHQQQTNNTFTSTKPEPFEVLIQIYGFNQTVLNLSPAYILNKDQQFNGVLKPDYQQQQKHLKQHQSLSLMQEDLNTFDDADGDAAADDDDDDDEYDDEIDYDDTNDNEDGAGFDEDDFDDTYDKIIEQGQRQEGDFLVYAINQTSATTTETKTNHSLTFYYIDIYYITYVRFTIYEHYLYHSISDYSDTYVVEYAHISPTTLKATVTDLGTESLYVQMEMYGFHPNSIPVDYKPFLSNGQTSIAPPSPVTSRPTTISSVRQLKILMNAQQSSDTQQQQNQQLQQQLQPVTELGQQISSQDNSNNNCMQQVLASTNIGNYSLTTFAHWSIFNFFVTIFVATMGMMIFM